jgi:hypothetical protein
MGLLESSPADQDSAVAFQDRRDHVKHEPIVQPFTFGSPGGYARALLWFVLLRRAGGLGLALWLTFPGWAQTAPEPPDATSSPAAHALPKHRPDSWKYSPIESEPYVPLSLKNKAFLFGYRAIAPASWGKSALAAGLAHWQNSPEEWEQGTKGFSMRYGHRMANRGVESVIGFGVAAVLHQDGRYFRNPEAGAGRRILHAVSQTFVTRTDSGGRTFSAWRFAANYGAQFVSNAWRPESQRDAGETMLRGTVSIGYDAAANIFKEFWPDVKRKIFKR